VILVLSLPPPFFCAPCFWNTAMAASSSARISSPDRAVPFESGARSARRGDADQGHLPPALLRPRRERPRRHRALMLTQDEMKVSMALRNQLFDVCRLL
jgi:hypothetical protein